MNSDILIQKLNKLEKWLEQSKGQYLLYPMRLGGYSLLIIVMMISNILAVIRWPFAHLFKENRSQPDSFDQTVIHEVNEEQLRELIQKQELVLVDFWADWCGPCIMMEKPLKKVARSKNISCTIVKVNTVSHPQVAEKYDVKGLPTLLLFHNGSQIKRYAGALSYSEIKNFILN